MQLYIFSWNVTHPTDGKIDPASFFSRSSFYPKHPAGGSGIQLLTGADELINPLFQPGENPQPPSDVTEIQDCLMLL